MCCWLGQQQGKEERKPGESKKVLSPPHNDSDDDSPFEPTDHGNGYKDAFKDEGRGSSYPNTIHDSPGDKLILTTASCNHPPIKL